MRTHSDFFSFRKINKNNNNSLNKYSQLPAFIPRNNFLHKDSLNISKNKENKRYFLNSNKIPNIRQKNIKSFSLTKKTIKLDSFFHISNINFYNTDSILQSSDSNSIPKTKNLKLNNTIKNNNLQYSSKTMPKNSTIYKLRTNNKIPFTKPKSNLKRFKLKNDINVNVMNMNNNDNYKHQFNTIKIDLHKKTNIKNNDKRTPEFNMRNLLNEKYKSFIEARHSIYSYDVISAYGVNTYKGIIRNYNEDRVSIIVNAKKPAHFISKNDNDWPNISFFAIFDGHAGNKCAEYLKTNLHNYIFNSPHFPTYPIKAIHHGFHLCEKNFINSIYTKPFNQYLDYSGSCAIVVLIINSHCFIANLGDSRAIYSYNTGANFYQLSRDHKPDDPKEKKRIYKAGGSIFHTDLDQLGSSLGIKETELGFKIPFRINPGRLAVSTFLII